MKGWVGFGAGLIIAATVGLSGCAHEDVDPLAVVQSADIADIRDNTGTGWYTVDSAHLSQTALGVELTLGFTILHANGVAFSPVSTIRFADGSVMRCEADDVRRVPGLVRTTDSWDFACAPDTLPADTDGAVIEIVDDYN